jgi:hypothetical protein
MTVMELDKKLLDKLIQYKKDVKSYCSIVEQRGSCTSTDLEELAKQVYYALYDFRKHIIDYLSSVERRDLLNLFSISEEQKKY